MKLIIESTTEIITIDGVPCRLWKGRSEDGRPFDVFVHRVGALLLASQSLAEEHLISVADPHIIDPPLEKTSASVPFSMRHIL